MVTKLEKFEIRNTNAVGIVTVAVEAEAFCDAIVADVEFCSKIPLNLENETLGS